MNAGPGSESPTVRYRMQLDATAKDMDELNHVSNLVYLDWVLRAAQAHSDAVGFHMAAYRRVGGVFIVRRHEIDYLRSAVAGDTIELVTWIDRWKGASSIRATSIRRASDHVELARANTTWVYVALDSGRPRRIPREVVDAFAKTV